MLGFFLGGGNTHTYIKVSIGVTTGRWVLVRGSGIRDPGGRDPGAGPAGPNRRLKAVPL